MDNRMPFRAIIVDFDRTLLHTDKTISAYTVRTLRDRQNAGARLFAATARPERAITAYCEVIPFDAVTTLNGARTVTNSAVFENTISRRSAEQILDRLYGIAGMVISVEAEDGIYASTDIPLWTPKVVDDLREIARRIGIYKILASHPEIPVDQIPLDLPEDTYITVAEGKLIQVMDRKATKWNGVRKMLEAYGIGAAEAVFFGDDNDDIEPIRKCGCGVAVSNALDSVKAVADYITESNDEDGVARFLSGLTEREHRGNL